MRCQFFLFGKETQKLRKSFTKYPLHCCGFLYYTVFIKFQKAKDYAKSY